jgi:nitrous oxide reductase
MPGNDQSNDRTDHPDASAPSHLSRRSLLGAAGVGAAGLAAGAFGGLGAAQAATARPAAAKSPHHTSEPAKADEQTNTDEHVVVHVRAGANADIDVFRGTSQTRLHDPDLAARLRRVAR